MYSTELIRKFPKEPEDPILYVVYNRLHIKEAKELIAIIHGQEYCDKHVTVVAFSDSNERTQYTAPPYHIYIDPDVYKYKNSWNN